MNTRRTASPSASAVITGTGHALPSRVVTNAELSARLGEDIHPFVSGTLGIHERRWCADGESTASLAETAGRRAMQSAGVDASMIDLLIVATDTPEFISPATSSVVQGALGCVNAGTFDVNAGCAGFVTALDVAWKYLRADERYSRILIIGAYAMSRWLDQSDKKTVTIFADGAGAVVLERVADTDYGVLSSELYADGRMACDMGVFAGGAAQPIDEAVLREGTHNHLRFVRKYPASINEEGWPRIARSVLSRCDATPDDVSLWLWTQVNRSTITAAMQSLAQPDGACAHGDAQVGLHRFGMPADGARRCGAFGSFARRRSRVADRLRRRAGDGLARAALAFTGAR